MNNKNIKYLKLIIIAGILLRFLFAGIFSDFRSDNYWEYGHIAKNIIEGKGYSYFYQKDNKIDYIFDDSSKPFPSAYMPPGYVATLLPFMLINDTLIRNLAIFSFQILLSALIIFLIFKLVARLYNEKVALLSSLIYAVIPEFLYSSVTFGTTIFYHLGVILFFLVVISEKSVLTKSIYIGFISSVIIYFRPEFLLFFGFFLLFILLKKVNREYIISLLIILALTSPWVIRNYLVFNEFPVFSTNTGQNFYRGHNNYRPGVWADETLAKKIDSIKPNKNYEIVRNQVFLDYALESIKSNPIKELTNDLEKIVHLWFFDYYDNRVSNIVYIVPWILILVFGIYGFIHTEKSLLKTILTLFFIYHTLLAVIFFAIPRYQTNMKIAIIFFTAFGIIMLWDKLKRLY